MPAGPVKAEILASGGWEFTRTLRHSVAGRTVTVADRFQPVGDSAPGNCSRFARRALDGGNRYGSLIIRPRPPPASGPPGAIPRAARNGLRDPLVLRPLANATWTVGGPMVSGRLTAIPLATIVEPVDDAGLSVVFSPDDIILAARLATHRVPPGSRPSRQ